MIARATARFQHLPTAAKLLLILTAALLPIGLALFFIAREGIQEANAALRSRSDEQARAAALNIESLIARNALALRIAANGALAARGGDPCANARRSLAIAPAVAQRFELRTTNGAPICAVGDVGPTTALPLVAPGDIQLRVAADREGVIFRTGVVGGIAIGKLSAEEIRAAALEYAGEFDDLYIADGERRVGIIAPRSAAEPGTHATRTRWPIGNGSLQVHVTGRVPSITTVDRLLLSLPVAMWVIAALMTWLMVTRLLIRPLRQLQRAVIRYQPGDAKLSLPSKLGPATEIQELRDSFARAVSRIEESEREMAGALEGQRRLVREVHHRVKNNLQVVASLLNIHGRSAGTPEARAAYASITRRVGALSIVHRNHYAEMEETRGIALRPLLTELAAELRAGAPEEARALAIDLEAEQVYTTQDVAVSVSFLITELVEHAMLHRPQDPIEIALRRTSELTARLTVASPVLVPEESEQEKNVQFERIITGLAKQLRSMLERRLGRYSVDLPVFPAG